MSTADNAIARLQAIALSSSDITIKHAPTNPSVDAMAFPMAIAHIADGRAVPMDASGIEIFPTIDVDFHFNITDLGQAYSEVNKVAIEFPRRLSGDPTLNATVDTIQEFSYVVGPSEYNGIPTLLLTFSIPIKTLEVPITT